jgi:hypothetical protein
VAFPNERISGRKPERKNTARSAASISPSRFTLSLSHPSMIDKNFFFFFFFVVCGENLKNKGEEEGEKKKISFLIT